MFQNVFIVLISKKINAEVWRLAGGNGIKFSHRISTPKLSYSPRDNRPYCVCFDLTCDEKKEILSPNSHAKLTKIIESVNKIAEKFLPRLSFLFEM